MVLTLDMTVGRPPNANAQARERIGMEMINNVFQSIVSGSTTPCPQTYFTDGQIKFVVNNQHIFRLYFVPAGEFSYRLTTEIHKGDRFSQYYFLKTNSATCQDCPVTPFRPFPTKFRGEFIYYTKAHIVASICIF